MNDGRLDDRIHVEQLRCPYCKDAVRPDDEDKAACGGCMTWSHAECVAEHGGCAGCGARSVQRVVTHGPGAGVAIKPRAPAVGEERACARCPASFPVRSSDCYSDICASCSRAVERSNGLLFAVFAAIFVLVLLAAFLFEIVIGGLALLR